MPSTMLRNFTAEIRTYGSGRATDYPLTLLLLFFPRKLNSEALSQMK